MKKCLSVIIAVCLIFSCTMFPSLATIQATNRNLSVFSQDELKIYNEKLAVIREQLAAQNATEMSKYYADMLYDEMLIAFNKGAPVTRGSDDESYYASNGGLATFIYNSQVGTPYIANAWHHMDRDDSYTYLLNVLAPGETFAIKELVKTLLGFVPYTGYITSLIFTVDTIVTSRALTDINNCDGYILVQNSNFIGSNSPISTMRGWTTHKMITPPTNAVDLNVYYY